MKDILFDLTCVHIGVYLGLPTQFKVSVIRDYFQQVKYSDMVLISVHLNHDMTYSQRCYVQQAGDDTDGNLFKLIIQAVKGPQMELRLSYK